MKKPVSEFKVNLLHVFSNNAILGLLNLLVTIYITRIVGADETGRYVLLLAEVEFCNILVSFGFNQYIIRTNDRSEETYRTVFTLITAQSALLFILTLSVDWISQWIRPEANISPTYHLFLLAMLASRVLNFFTTFFYSYLEIDLKYRLLSRLRTFSGIFSIVISFLVLYNIKDFSVFIWKEVAAVVSLFVLVYFYTGHKPGFGTTNYKNILRYTSRNYVLNLQEKVLQRGDQFVLSYFLTPANLGNFYVLKNFFDGILNFLITPVQTVLYSYFVKTDIKRRVNVFVAKRFHIIMSVVAFACIIYFLDFSRLLEVIYGADFTFSALSVALFTIYAISVLMFEVLKVFSMSVDRQELSIKARTFQIVLFFSVLLIIVSNALPFYLVYIVYAASFLGVFVHLATLISLKYQW